MYQFIIVIKFLDGYPHECAYGPFSEDKANRIVDIMNASSVASKREITKVKWIHADMEAFEADI